MPLDPISTNRSTAKVQKSGRSSFLKQTLADIPIDCYQDLEIGAKVALGLRQPDISLRKQNILRVKAFAAAVKIGCEDPSSFKSGPCPMTSPLLDFTKLDPNVELIVLGDVHARNENLLAILKAEGNWEKVVSGKAVLLFIGDLVHPEMGSLSAMQSSVLTLNWYEQLKILAPLAVFNIVGNHDYLNSECAKGDVEQTRVFRTALKASFAFDANERITRKMLMSGSLDVASADSLTLVSKNFIERAAFAAVAQGFSFFHAAPPTMNVDSYEKLAYYRIKDLPLSTLLAQNNEYSDAQIRSSWARYKPDAEITALGDYGPKLIEHWKKLTPGFGAKEKVIILGHNPAALANGDRSIKKSHWIYAKNTPAEHHILVSCHPRPAYASILNGKMKIVTI